MSELPVLKRKYHSFLSHAHADKDFVEHLDHWLHDISGIPIWYDDRDLPPGSQIVAELPDAIAKCRSIILILSKTSIERGWVQEEYQAAIGQRVNTRGRFRILAVRIEECDIPGLLQTTKWIDIRNGNLDIQIINEILDGLYHNNIGIDLERVRDVYVSRSWRPDESPFADNICKILIKKGFRLIGDSEDQPGFDENRIRSIMSSCGGLVAILPNRGQGNTSKYVLKEIDIGRSLSLHSLIIADRNVKLSKELAQSAINLDNISAKDHLESTLQDKIEDLEEAWKISVHQHYVFFATDLTKNGERNQIIKEHIQRITSMPCILGDRIREGSVQQIIIRKISDAFVMIADISEDNLNTFIEAGIARGAGTRLHLVAQGPRHTPAFMFRDQQVEYYSDDAELLGTINRIIYPYRRRVIDYDLI